MDSLRLVFYGFATIALGSIAVASGGVRVIALVVLGDTADPEGLQRIGIWLSLTVGALFVLAGILLALWRRPDGYSDRR